MTPDTLLMIAGGTLAGSCVAGYFLGRIFGEAHKVKTEIVYRTPPALQRLASVLRITEDIPASESYGRLIHDLFNEKDNELLKAKREAAVERSAAEALREEIDGYLREIERNREALEFLNEENEDLQETVRSLDVKGSEAPKGWTSTPTQNFQTNPQPYVRAQKAFAFRAQRGDKVWVDSRGLLQPCGPVVPSTAPLGRVVQVDADPSMVWVDFA